MSSIQQIADKLAVPDALYRFFAGIDHRDKTVLASSLAENAVSDFTRAGAKAGFEYPVLEGRETIISALTTSLASLDTSHNVSNPRVTLNGDKAYLEALVGAQHVPRDDSSRHYLMMNHYKVDLIRHGEAWVILTCTVDNIWRDGDVAVLSMI
ncbi:uncharacterized protein TRUGW13939_08970 [Talaromyces rugulosus]|uniref:SnoaL-like domain-containing protein n=1 Tax=Talaromyces rugulosus TaxID=121627 RepID=A0A7H8R617_TALRU|nr:uncharacterized protein TRUGW13939_08970 [Talaromyces rugulosus]QKX61814.1 hypothetical protein TRUGW13939_08970 [Talaromyces rugulosus]